jgi:CBS domain containing-hemolysin-like protein
VNEQLTLLLTGCGLLALVTLVSLADSSLRAFSRSRLEAICRERGRPELFGVILARRERVQLAVNCLYALSLVVAGGVCVVWWWRVADVEGGWSRVGVVGVSVSALLMASVVLPWAVGRVWGERFLVRSWRALCLVTLVLAPVSAIVEQLDRLCHRIAGRPEPVSGDLADLSDEIRSVVDEGQRGGYIETSARAMIHRVMELRDEDVAEVMTPRTDMICLRADASLEDARRQLLEAGHTRVPVVGETTDDIVGILYAKDLLGHLQVDTASAPGGLREIVREPFYVPETTGIDTLLETLKREQVHLAVVLDEYGGVAGLVTLEDILEEIVGEIEDEYDVGGGDLVKTIGPTTIEVDARAHIDDLNERFGYGLPEDEDYDTLGGFVITRLGRIPVPGETLEWGQWRFSIESADKRRVRRLRVEPGEDEAEPTA